MLHRLIFSLLLLMTFQAWSSPTLKPVVLQLKWYHQFQFAGYYAALEKGYYKQSGLDVTIREGDPNQDPIDDVVKGEADFGIGASELLLARAAGKPVVALAVILQHSPLILLARQSADIQSIHDLIGKQIRVVPHEYELNAMFHAMGYSEHDFSLGPRTPHDIDDLIAGKVAAISSYSTDEPYFLEKRHIPMLQVTPRSFGVDFYGDTLFTREQLIKHSPKMVEAFRQASLKGWRYAMNHPEEITELILAKYAPGKNREHLLWEARQMHTLMLPEMVDIGYMSRGRWDFIRDTYASLELLPANMPLNKFLYNPNPVQRDLTWFYLIAAASLGIALIVAGVGTYIFYLNRKLRLSESNLRQLLDTSPLPIIITRPIGNTIAYINSRAEEHFHVKNEKVMNRPAPDFWVDTSRRAQMFQQLQRNGYVNDFEAELKTDDGSHFWGYLSATLSRYQGEKVVVVSFNDISERKRMESALRASEQRYRMLAENAFDVIWTFDLAAARYTYVSPSTMRLRGYTVEEVMRQSLAEIFTEDSRRQVEEGIRQLMATGELPTHNWELEQPCKDGSSVWTSTIITLVRNDHGKPVEVMGISRDITEQRQLREELQTRSVAIESAAESVMITDQDGLIQYVNPAFCRMTGYSSEEAVGEKANITKSGLHDDAFYKNLWETIMGGQIWRGEITNRNKHGELYTESTAIAPVIDDSGDIIHFVAIKHDITARKRLEERLDHMAHYDMLTGVPNRQLFFGRLNQALSLAHRHQQQLALLFIDLDGFKEVNDNYGHEAGDALLRGVAQNLREALRDSDTVARVGGDEFAILLNDITADTDLSAIIEKLMAAVVQPVKHAGHSHSVGASIGVALYPEHGTDAETLFTRADYAMYISKRAGKSCWHLYQAASR